MPSCRTKRGKGLRTAAAAIGATSTAILIVFFLGTWWSTHPKPVKTDASRVEQVNEVTLPQYRPLQSEQEVSALKEEEVRLAKQLLRDFPGHVDAFMQIAGVYRRQGDAIQSLAVLQHALKAHPRHAEIYLRMAEISQEKGELERTVDEYQAALRLRPRLPDALTKMAKALNMLGKQDEAIAALERAIEISPERSTPYLLMGQAYLQQKEYPKAGENYRKAAQYQPDASRAQYGLAQVHRRLGNLDQAQKHSKRFRELKAKERQDEIGRKRRYDDGAVAQKSAATTHLQMGRMYRDQGKMPQAETLLKRAIGLDPNNVICYMELAAIYNATGAPGKALTLFNRVCQMQPNNPTTYLMMGIISAHLKRADDAEAAFNTLIRLAPQMSDGYRELARLYLQSGKKTPQARRLAEKAIALETNAANYFMLAWARMKAGDKAAALPAVKRALELEPENPDCQRLYRMIQQGH